MPACVCNALPDGKRVAWVGRACFFTDHSLTLCCALCFPLPPSFPPIGKRKKSKQRADKEVTSDHTPAAPRSTAAAATFKANGAARQRPKPRDLKSRAKALWAQFGKRIWYGFLGFLLCAVILWLAFDDLKRAKSAPAAAAWSAQ